jgi:hypothetical protein
VRGQVQEPSLIAADAPAWIAASNQDTCQ